ncbi:MAG: hypothetical protein Q9199_001290 [Rusavskia elegans]
MTTADVRDMLGLPTDGQPKIRPAKKAKQEAKGRRPGGLEREIQSLHGDRPAPPLSINELPKYKEKPKRTQRYRHWDITPFGNNARKDGLVLRHWNWRDDVNTNVFPTTPADSNAASEEQDDRFPKPTSDYKYAKYNVRIDRPVYSDEQYDAQLKNEDWTKDETDYLVDLAYEFDLRWVVIADRYDYQPPQIMQQGHPMGITNTPKHRTMEDMKARYYQVAAIAMALVNRLTSMSESEFAIHEKMTKFDPTLETKRKQFAEGMLSRSRDEIQEEEILLSELKRIVKNEEKFMQDRQELYARLETAPSTTTTTVNRSSEGLTQLLKTLCEAEKNKRKRILGGDGSSTPANGMSGQNAGGPGDRGQRHSLGGADKRSSLSGSQGQRQLSMRDQLKYGVTHHERLSAGVQFRHEKILKLSQAKSNAHSTKINAALTELGIPARIYMPTAKTTNEYERLIQSINILLDVRKTSEKVDTEIKVIQAQREPKEFTDGDRGMELSSDPLTRGEAREEGSPGSQNAENADDAEDAAAEAEADGEGDGDRDDDGDVDADVEADAEADVEADAEADVEADVEEDVDASDRNEEDSEEEYDEEDEKDVVSNDDGGDEGDGGEEVDNADHVEEQDSDSGEESADGMDPSGARSTSGRKRSASLISTTSNKSSKRQKR